MRSRTCHLLLLAAAAMASQAADIDGQVTIKRRLTRRTVTASAPAYHRGAAIEPSHAEAEDVLAFENTRVVVYLEGLLSSEPVVATLEQQNRRFIPDLVVVPAGSRVSFPNRDAIFHNVFSLSKPKTFDLGNYSRDETRTIVLPKPGIVHINCHLHPNMTATIVVTPNRWTTRADASGRFVLPDVPPGSYVIVAWHKAAGFFRQRVEVKPDRTANVSFFIPFEAKGTISAKVQR
jgi:plastocyanin